MAKELISKYLELSRAKKMQEFHYLPFEEPKDFTFYDIVQPKYDGWFSIAVLEKDHFNIYSRSGEYLDSKKIRLCEELNEVVLIGEFMVGTHWSMSNLSKTFVVFDILRHNGKYLTDTPYSMRLELIQEYIDWLNPQDIECVKTWSITEFVRLWEEFVEAYGWEGLVIKDSQSLGYPNEISSAKVKKIYTMDYVVARCTEGGGRNKGKLGALVGGLYKTIDNKKVFQEVCSVGGGFSDKQRQEIWNNQEQYIGKVFEAKGWAVFESGALRHPNFLRWRKDKRKTECCISL